MSNLLYFSRVSMNNGRTYFLDIVDRNEIGEYIRLSMKEGLMKPPIKLLTTEEEGEEVVMKEYPMDIDEYTDEQKKRHTGDRLARSILLQGIPNEIYVKIDSYKATGKQMWDKLEKMMLGSKIGNQLKVSNCLNNYEEFKAKEGESLESTYDRFVTLLN
ncbi:hypothetical protein L6452_18073 [Arctium lappa]|uniref:Uncharacterized protein n=1 Tax=Arctium lappa TaxID=4217 RepID=A0ACB9C575_ARCLA|nr:hypothetical protein L6452_18073 [Arctium lappa]